MKGLDGVAFYAVKIMQATKIREKWAGPLYAVTVQVQDSNARDDEVPTYDWDGIPIRSDTKTNLVYS